MRGGNAVDAALSAAIALTVVEPNNNGLGSDAFALVWDGAELAGLNASGRAPALWTPERFRDHDRMPRLGWDSVTVPGAVSAWVALSRRYGVLPFEDLFEPALRYARDGFQVGPVTAAAWHHADRTYRRFPEFARQFLPAPGAGERFTPKHVADTLERIARSEGQDFYHGRIAEQIEQAALRDGGALRRTDLEAHSADWVQPVAEPYRDVVLHEIPPNGQGLAAQIALAILAHLEPAELESERWYHQQIEAMKIAIHAAQQHFADPRAMRVSPGELLSEPQIRQAAATISEHASPLPPVELPVSHDTVYLTAADQSGMMVSFIQSNYMGFGSGIVIPDTGIALQNRGAGFVLDPKHPNCVGPGKRPYHTIIPGFVTDEGGARLSFGVMGGHMQHQGHVQMVTRIFDHAQNPQTASDAPRWHVTEDFRVLLEAGTNPDVVSALAHRGHQVKLESATHLFGGAQLILRTSDGYVAGSDHRKEGQACGY